MGDDAARTITADDVMSMNRASIDRSAYLARLAGSVLIAVGLLMAVSWVWAQVRAQQQLDGSIRGRMIVTSLGSTDGRPTWAVRIDVFTTSVSALWPPALALAGGFGLRMLADLTQSRVGGSTTGFVEGAKKQADAHAEAEYARFAAQRRALLEAEGEKYNLKILETAAETLPSRIRKPKPTDES